MGLDFQFRVVASICLQVLWRLLKKRQKMHEIYVNLNICLMTHSKYGDPIMNSITLSVIWLSQGHGNNEETALLMQVWLF